MWMVPDGEQRESGYHEIDSKITGQITVLQ